MTIGGTHTMAKRRKAAKKAARKPASKPARRAKSGKDGDNTVNALAILVVIVIALAGGYLYQQNSKPAGVTINASPAGISIEKK